MKTVITAAALLALSTGISEANPALSPYSGSWSGNGTFATLSGARENLKCTASIPLSGNTLKVNVRCASASGGINARSVIALNGSALTGTWEERTYNAEGTLRGTLLSNEISLTLNGPFVGSMRLSVSGKTLKVSLSSTKFGNASVTLAK